MSNSSCLVDSISKGSSFVQAYNVNQMTYHIIEKLNTN